MRRARRAVLAINLAAAVASPALPARADCRGADKPTSFKLGQTHETEMTLSSGSSCGFDFRALRGAVDVVAPPRHGALFAREPKQFRYEPQADFVGADEMTIRICGDGAKAGDCALVAYRLTVH